MSDFFSGMPFSMIVASLPIVSGLCASEKLTIDTPSRVLRVAHMAGSAEMPVSHGDFDILRSSNFSTPRRPSMEKYGVNMCAGMIIDSESEEKISSSRRAGSM